MKNQYFGDIRDLFKFDLIEEIASVIGFSCFTYIPMLTPNDNKNEGRKRDFFKAKAGNKNKHLMEFLYPIRFEQKDKRDIRNIKEYFKKFSMNTEIYKGDIYFETKNRSVYFREARLDLLKNSLIFVDPDNGLEVKKKNTDKHILYSEIEEIHRKMENSLLMAIQFKKPIDKPEFWIRDIIRRSVEIYRIIGDLPLFVTDYEIAFFILTKSLEIKTDLSKILLNYTLKYPRLLVGNLILKNH